MLTIAYRQVQMMQVASRLATRKCENLQTRSVHVQIGIIYNPVKHCSKLVAETFP
jgi:hypothetical protein